MTSLSAWIHKGDKDSQNLSQFDSATISQLNEDLKGGKGQIVWCSLNSPEGSLILSFQWTERTAEVFPYITLLSIDIPCLGLESISPHPLPFEAEDISGELKNQLDAMLSILKACDVVDSTLCQALHDESDVVALKLIGVKERTWRSATRASTHRRVPTPTNTHIEVSINNPAMFSNSLHVLRLTAYRASRPQ